MQLGDAGGIETTGYEGSTVWLSGTGQGVSGLGSGWNLHTGFTAASNEFSGSWELVLMDEATNLWSMRSMFGTDASGTGFAAFVAGTKSLSGELTTIRLTTVGGTDTFDNGAINVQYDNPSLVGGDTVYVAGGVVQTVVTQDGEFASTSTALPFATTVPQNTEGAEFMTCSITPTNANNKLVIDARIFCSTASSVQWQSMALFQDSTASALASIAQWETTANGGGVLTLRHEMTAGTTSSTTFKIRGGAYTATTFYFNGSSGIRYHGGVLASTLSITEYAA